ncbi:MAG: aminotransferase class I/II-fold pyridoxal phosphate-dependent enzyme [Chloroflexi bacterium]|nr:aminotransferase class I/II-fold pyridoxal phosphate-dependent enzyme [Chloroflexota bacterium]
MEKISTHFFNTRQEKVKRLIDEGKDVICLDIGSPDMPPPQHIIDTLCNAANDPQAHGYQAHNATEALRHAWAEMYHREFGVKLDPNQQVLPLMGSKEGIFHLMQALVNPGDIVLLPDPYYPTYLKSVLFAGGEAYFMPLLSENDFLPDLTQIPRDIASRAKLIWINYPNNPTAAVAPLSFYQEVIQFAQEFKLLVCHDAAYSQIYFDGYRPTSLFQVPGAEKLGIEFNSLSKSHNLAGWRVGAALGNEQSVQTLLSLKTNTDSGHFLPILRAAATALTQDQSWQVERNNRYQIRRDIVVEKLLELGFETSKPLGSFYLWVKVPRGQSANQLADRLLDEVYVSVAPGGVFGQGGEGYFRIALTQPKERLEEAMGRLEEAVSL